MVNENCHDLQDLQLNTARPRPSLAPTTEKPTARFQCRQLDQKVHHTVLLEDVQIHRPDDARISEMVIPCCILFYF